MTLPDLPIPPSAHWAPCAVCHAVVQDQQVHAEWHAFIAELDDSVAALEQALPPP